MSYEAVSGKIFRGLCEYREIRSLNIVFHRTGLGAQYWRVVLRTCEDRPEVSLLLPKSQLMPRQVACIAKISSQPATLVPFPHQNAIYKHSLPGEYEIFFSSGSKEYITCSDWLTSCHITGYMQDSQACRCGTITNKPHDVARGPACSVLRRHPQIIGLGCLREFLLLVLETD